MPALKDVSLEVRAGDVVGIHGASRSGKTTLMKIAAGFEPPDTGRVLFQGQDMADLSDDARAHLRREQIAFAEREAPHIPDLPALEYVAIPLYGRASVSTALDRAATMLDRLGIAYCSDQRWDQISDAGRVLVGLAHALVRQPRLLILDDLAASLGVLDRHRVLQLLHSYAETDNIGVLMTAPDTLEMLHSNVRMLSRGRLIAPDTAAEPTNNVFDLDIRRQRA